MNPSSTGHALDPRSYGIEVVRQSRRMRKLRKFMVIHNFTEFLPLTTDFQIEEEQINKLAPNEFLVKAEYISVDPYMRSFAKGFQVPYEQFGFQVGKVKESRNAKFPVGANVVSHAGWRDYAVLNDTPDDIFGIHPYIPDLGRLSPSLAIGALGMTGLTAYLGLMEICRPKAGEVLVVTSAAGAVGSIAGQIGKVLGCTVVGFTGSDRKVKLIKEEFGFDHAFNYKTGNAYHILKEFVPNGVDCFFDNVGGELAGEIIRCMREYGRVANCGSISTYGDTTSSVKNIRTLVSVQIESFSFTQWKPKHEATFKQLKAWLESGTIKAKETIVKGFEELPNTFAAMLKGDTVGKAVVKVL
ncbi:prostaglandin reductase 1-like isoform X2 [Plodia interpunctella]|uniref:prostaglandin reductase 1-like isoform X2 n=1 Tax=Plodia interpunctella TaxID=58824 RepID=UPI002368C827|nr:prostaglandin reductase 1-like isoform X2 [Plodia interpunctella]